MRQVFVQSQQDNQSSIMTSIDAERHEAWSPSKRHDIKLLALSSIIITICHKLSQYVNCHGHYQSPSSMVPFSYQRATSGIMIRHHQISFSLLPGIITIRNLSSPSSSSPSIITLIGHYHHQLSKLEIISSSIITHIKSHLAAILIAITVIRKVIFCVFPNFQIASFVVGCWFLFYISQLEHTFSAKKTLSIAKCASATLFV